MKLPIDMVRRMALPLYCSYRKESWIALEIQPQRFFYKLNLRGNVISVSRRRFLERLDAVHDDEVEYTKYNGAKIINTLWF